MGKFRTLDLFSGLGGFAYGLKSISNVVAYCEKSSDCQAVLSRNMSLGRISKGKIFGDVQKLQVKDLPRNITMITGGFPCQDISAANPHGKGIQGERSGLVMHIFRLLKDMPTVTHVILENSPRIKVKGLDKLVELFGHLGFSCKWTTVACTEVGIPMLRQRWFCLATRNNAIKTTNAKTLKPLKLTPHNWNVEPVNRLILKGPDYFKNLHRLQMLGNAVVPQCLQRAVNHLMFGVDTGANPPDVDIELHLYGGKRFKSTRWPSPTTVWQPCLNDKAFGSRCRRMLVTQMFYDARTKMQVPDSLAKHMSHIYVANPRWVEWLMGFPEDHTFFTR